MAHIFFIDPLEKLNIKKDSTLMMALSFQNLGLECYLLFEKDFYVTNENDSILNLYRFNGDFKDDGCYLNSLSKSEMISREVSENDILMEPIYESNAYEIKIYRQDPILLEWAFVGIGIVLLGLWFFCIKLFVKLKLKEF